MTDLLTDFETYFKLKGVLTNMFRDTMPDTPDVAISMYEYQGDNPVPQVQGSYRPVQLVVRDLSATTAKNKAREIYKTLMTEDGILNLTSERWCVIDLKQMPFRLKSDDAGRVYYAFNIGTITYID
jgi:hypothetical protein